jgi:hypothetical protein
VISTRFHRVGATGIAALTVVALVSGCNSSKSSSSAAATTSAAAAAPSAAAGTSAAAAPSTSAAAAPSTAAAAVPSAALPSAATPTKVVATGGGKFCQEAAAVSNAGLSAASQGITPADVKAQVAQYKAEEKVVLATAPGSIKPDMQTLFAGVDKLYAALVAANYDYTKLDPTTLTSFDTPAFEAASNRVDAYLKNTCGIDTGDDASDSPAAS